MEFQNLIRKCENKKKILSMIKGVRKFAWFPTELADGTKIWLEYYWHYYKGSRNGSKGNIYFNLWSCSRDSYTPYGPRYLNRHGKAVTVTDYYREDNSYVMSGHAKDILIETEGKSEYEDAHGDWRILHILKGI